MVSLGLITRGSSRMEGADESTKLVRHALFFTLQQFLLFTVGCYELKRRTNERTHLPKLIRDCFSRNPQQT